MSRIALMSAVAFVAILGAASLAAADTLNKTPSSNGQPQCNSQAGKPAPTVAQCQNQGSKWIAATPSQWNPHADTPAATAVQSSTSNPNLSPAKIHPGNAAPIKPLVTNNTAQPGNPPNKGWTSATPSQAVSASSTVSQMIGHSRDKNAPLPAAPVNPGDQAGRNGGDNPKAVLATAAVPIASPTPALQLRPGERGAASSIQPYAVPGVTPTPIPQVESKTASSSVLGKVSGWLFGGANKRILATTIIIRKSSLRRNSDYAACSRRTGFRGAPPRNGS